LEHSVYVIYSTMSGLCSTIYYEQLYIHIGVLIQHQSINIPYTNTNLSADYYIETLK